MAGVITITRKDTLVLKRMIAQAPRLARRAGTAVAEAMVTEMKESMGTSPAGEIYWHGNVIHVASQPYYPPNVDTGALRASLMQEQAGDDLRWTIFDQVDYGVYLEFGTERMLPRPFMTPVFEKYRQGEFVRVFKETFEKL